MSNWYRTSGIVMVTVLVTMGAYADFPYVKTNWTNEQVLVTALIHDLLGSSCGLVIISDIGDNGRISAESITMQSAAYRPVMSLKRITETHMKPVSFTELSPLFGEWTRQKCTLHVIIPRSPNALSTLVLQLANIVRVDNLRHHFMFHLETFPATDVLVTHPIRGIRKKLVTHYRDGRLELFSVCIFCPKDAPSLIPLGPYPREPASLEIYPNVWSDMQGAPLLLSIPDQWNDLPNMSEIRSKIALEGPTPTLTAFEHYLRILCCSLNCSNFEYVLTPVDPTQTELKYPNGTWVGPIGTVQSGRAPLTVASFITEHSYADFAMAQSFVHEYITFVTHSPRAVLKWQALCSPYSPTLWIVTMATNCILVCVIAVVLKHTDSYAHYKLPSLLLVGARYVIRFLIEQAQPLTMADRFSGLHLMLTVFFLYGILLTNAYKTRLLSLLTSPDREEVPVTFRQLLDQYNPRDPDSYTWGSSMFETLLLNNIGITTGLADYIRLATGEMFSNPFSCMRAAQRRGQFACVIISFYLRQYQPFFSNYQGQLDLVTSIDRIPFSNMGSAVGRGEVIAPIVHNLVKVSSESGLADKWWRDEQFMYFLRTWEKIQLEKSKDEEVETELVSDQTVDLSKLITVFIGWSVGLGFATLVFLGEWATFKGHPTNTVYLP